MITSNRLREVFDYSHDTGLFTRKIDSGKRWKAGQQAGSIHRHNGYVVIGIDGYNYFAHRLVWLYVYDQFPDLDIDHIDGDKTNNKLSNLRCVSKSTNLQNQKKSQKGSFSGLLGAYPSGKRWRALIAIDHKTICIGSFATKEEAHQAYLTKKRLIHEGNTL